MHLCSLHLITTAFRKYPFKQVLRGIKCSIKINPKVENYTIPKARSVNIYTGPIQNSTFQETLKEARK